MITSAVENTRASKGKSLLSSILDFTVIDLETTGLSPAYDQIIEFGAIRYRNGAPVDSFQSLVNINRALDPFITELTGITDDMLASAPALKDILPEYISFIGSDVVLGQNVNFDINFIYDSCVACGLDDFSNDYIDTMRLSRRMYKDLPNHKLDTIAAALGVSGRGLHRSLGDCDMTAECYLHMIADADLFDQAMKSTSSSGAQSIVAEDGLQNPDSPFYGKVCVFTGTLESFTRAEAMQQVVNIGGLCEDGVNKRTNFLILGNNDYCKSIKDGKSNKQKKAEQLILKGAELQIIPESVFIDMLK